MNVGELIAMLKQYPKESNVEMWDAESDEYQPVTGAVYECDGETLPTVTLQCDEP